MRKVLLLNVLALTLFSCAVEESASRGTASISAIITPEAKASSLTGKDVKRGNIYPWVKDIILTAASNDASNVVTETFTLVPSTTAGAEDVFRLDGVSTGNNTISAISTTSTVGENTLTVAKGVASAVVKASIERNPYAVYSSTPMVKNISESDNNVISIPMNTLNGRVIGVFSANDTYLLRNFEVWVEVMSNNVTLPKVRIQAGDVAKFYYSDATAVGGVNIRYRVFFVNIKTQRTIETQEVVLNVEASTSYSCNYTVTTDMKLTKDDNRFTFVFQPWKETTCPTCPGN